MVTIRRINVSELHDLITYDEIKISLENQCYCNNKEYFAVIDGDRILGHALTVLFTDISAAEIIEIYILPQERKQGLGDALLRTVFNYLRINFFTWAIIKDNGELESFLINKEIAVIDFQNFIEQIKTVLEEDCTHKYYVCNIVEFFKRKCIGSKFT